MRVSLEYVVGGERVLLESMELKQLDEYTYKTFDTVDDIKNNVKYKNKIAAYTDDGEVKIFFNTMDVPLKEMDKYVTLGGNPLEYEGCLSPLVRSDKMTPTLGNIREKMGSFITSEEVAREFYQTFEKDFSPRDQFEFLIGLNTENAEFASRGIKNVMLDYTDGYEGYFMGRVFVESLKEFSSIKKEATTKK